MPAVATIMAATPLAAPIPRSFDLVSLCSPCSFGILVPLKLALRSQRDADQDHWSYELRQDRDPFGNDKSADRQPQAILALSYPIGQPPLSNRAPARMPCLTRSTALNCSRSSASPGRCG